MVRYVLKETLRGSGDLLADDKVVATVLYSLGVYEGEEEFNGVAYKTGVKRIEPSIMIMSANDPTAVMVGKVVILRLADGRQLRVLVHRTDGDPTNYSGHAFVVAGELEDPE